MAPSMTSPSVLLAGCLVDRLPSFSSDGSRLLVPCRDRVFVFSVKTQKQIGVLTNNDGIVTSVCASPKKNECPDFVGIGTSTGKLCVWDSKSLIRLCDMAFPTRVEHLRWSETMGIIVLLGDTFEKSINVAIVNVSKDSQIQLVKTLNLCKRWRHDSSLSSFDAIEDVVVVSDGPRLFVHVGDWNKTCEYKQLDCITALAIDPLRRYVVTGDELGVVLLWWGVLDDGGRQRDGKPERWHWHTKRVHALAHVGPMMLSAGCEGVLCMRQADGDVTFKPHFPAGLHHIIASPTTEMVCVSVANNSLALYPSLHGQKSLWIRSLAMPVFPGGLKAMVASARMLIKDVFPLVHPLEKGMAAVTASHQSMQFINSKGSLLQKSWFELNDHNFSHEADMSQQWVVQQAAFAPDRTCIMTCEKRTAPVLQQFHPHAACNYVVKWWRRKDDESYVMENVSYNPHASDITAALSHPLRESFFITTSLDGVFKCWETPEIRNTTDDASIAAWSCTLFGGWNMQPILCGSLNSDGSVLALGFFGFVVLWESSSGNQLCTLAIDGVAVLQLFCRTCNRLMLVAHVHSEEEEGLVCWDLVKLEIVARLDLRQGVANNGVHWVVRAAPSSDGLRLLMFQRLHDQTELHLYDLSSTPNCVNILKVAQASPPGDSVLDASIMLDGRVLCYTSSLELWEVTLEATRIAGGPALEDSPDEIITLEEMEQPDVPKLARLFAATAEGSVVPPEKLYSLPFRTTPAQNMRITMPLLESVLPVKAPSHVLPLPIATWNNFLAVFGKQRDATSADIQVTNRVAQHGPDSLLNTVPHDISRTQPPTSRRQKYELADIGWMNQLVEEAFLPPETNGKMEEITI